MQQNQYSRLNNSELKNIYGNTESMNAQLEGLCGIMVMSYSTKELKGTSHLKKTRLIGFMQNFGNELPNSRISWTT